MLRARRGLGVAVFDDSFNERAGGNGQARHSGRSEVLPISALMNAISGSSELAGAELSGTGWRSP